MEIKYSFENYVLEFKLEGELDENSAFALRTTVDRVITNYLSSGLNKVVLNLSEVSFMDSTGIGVLLGRYKKFTKFNIELNIKHPSGNADKILKMAGIYEIMPKIY